MEQRVGADLPLECLTDPPVGCTRMSVDSVATMKRALRLATSLRTMANSSSVIARASIQPTSRLLRLVRVLRFVDVP